MTENAVYGKTLEMIARAIYSNLYARTRSMVWVKTLNAINEAITYAQVYGQLKDVILFEHPEFDEFNDRIRRHRKQGLEWEKRNSEFFALLASHGFSEEERAQLRMHIARFEDGARQLNQKGKEAAEARLRKAAAPIRNSGLASMLASALPDLARDILANIEQRESEIEMMVAALIAAGVDPKRLQQETDLRERMAAGKSPFTIRKRGKKHHSLYRGSEFIASCVSTSSATTVAQLLNDGYRAEKELRELKKKLSGKPGASTKPTAVLH